MIILEKLSASHELDERYTKSLQIALKRYCLTLTQSPWDAEDLAQDTWVKSLSYMKTSDSGSTNPLNENNQMNHTSHSNHTNHTNHTNQVNHATHPNPEALLLRIARNTWIDRVRRKATLSRLLELEQSRTEDTAAHGSFEIETAFQALQEHLSPLQQAVFLLRDVFGHSGIEAAEILDTTEGAVKAALHRARQALPVVRQELLQADGPTLPQDADMLITLSRLASAYAQGQIAELIELVFAGETQEPVIAVSNQNLQTFQFIQSGGFNSTNSTSWNYARPGMWMVA